MFLFQTTSDEWQVQHEQTLQAASVQRDVADTFF